MWLLLRILASPSSTFHIYQSLHPFSSPQASTGCYLHPGLPPCSGDCASPRAPPLALHILPLSFQSQEPKLSSAGLRHILSCPHSLSAIIHLGSLLKSPPCCPLSAWAVLTPLGPLAPTPGSMPTSWSPQYSPAPGYLGAR